MKTTREIIYDVIHACEPFYTDDTELLDEEEILKKMDDLRGVQIRNALQRFRSLDNQWYQYTCCFEVKCKENSCDGIGSGDVYYYIDDLDLIGGLDGKEIKYLGDTDINTPGYTKVTLHEYQNIAANKWTGTDPVYTIQGGIPFIRNLPTTGLKYVCALAIHSHPVSICDTELDDDYPVPDAEIQAFEIAVIRHFLSSKGLPADTINNAIDDTLNRKVNQEQKKRETLNQIIK